MYRRIVHITSNGMKYPPYIIKDVTANGVLIVQRSNQDMDPSLLIQKHGKWKVQGFEQPHTVTISKTVGIENLPVEILETIKHFIDPADLHSFAKTDKRLKEVVTEEEMCLNPDIIDICVVNAIRSGNYEKFEEFLTISMNQKYNIPVEIVLEVVNSQDVKMAHVYMNTIITMGRYGYQDDLIIPLLAFNDIEIVDFVVKYSQESLIFWHLLKTHNVETMRTFLEKYEGHMSLNREILNDLFPEMMSVMDSNITIYPQYMINGEEKIISYDGILEIANMLTLDQIKFIIRNYTKVTSGEYVRMNPRNDEEPIIIDLIYTVFNGDPNLLRYVRSMYPFKYSNQERLDLIRLHKYAVISTNEYITLEDSPRMWKNNDKLIFSSDLRMVGEPEEFYRIFESLNIGRGEILPHINVSYTVNNYTTTMANRYNTEITALRVYQNR